jgi:hypothetical protein
LLHIRFLVPYKSTPNKKFQLNTIFFFGKNHFCLPSPGNVILFLPCLCFSAPNRMQIRTGNRTQNRIVCRWIDALFSQRESYRTLISSKLYIRRFLREIVYVYTAPNYGGRAGSSGMEASSVHRTPMIVRYEGVHGRRRYHCRRERSSFNRHAKCLYLSNTSDTVQPKPLARGTGLQRQDSEIYVKGL